MISNKITNKITKASKKLPQNASEAVESETETPRGRYISQLKKGKLLMN